MAITLSEFMMEAEAETLEEKSLRKWFKRPMSRVKEIEKYADKRQHRGPEGRRQLDYERAAAAGQIRNNAFNTATNVGMIGGAMQMMGSKLVGPALSVYAAGRLARGTVSKSEVRHRFPQFGRGVKRAREQGVEYYARNRRQMYGIEDTPKAPEPKAPELKKPAKRTRKKKAPALAEGLRPRLGHRMLHAVKKALNTRGYQERVDRARAGRPGSSDHFPQFGAKASAAQHIAHNLRGAGKQLPDLPRDQRNYTTRKDEQQRKMRAAQRAKDAVKALHLKVNHERSRGEGDDDDYDVH